MSKEQLKFLEKDLLFNASKIVGVQGVDHADTSGYRLPNLVVDPDTAALGRRGADEQFTRYQYLDKKEEINLQRLKKVTTEFMQMMEQYTLII